MYLEADEIVSNAHLIHIVLFSMLSLSSRTASLVNLHQWLPTSGTLGLRPGEGMVWHSSSNQVFHIVLDIQLMAEYQFSTLPVILNRPPCQVCQAIAP